MTPWWWTLRGPKLFGMYFRVLNLHVFYVFVSFIRTTSYIKCISRTLWRRSVVFPWKRDRPVADASTCTTHISKTDIHAPFGIRTRSTSNRAAADVRITRHGPWDQQNETWQRRILNNFNPWQCSGVPRGAVHAFLLVRWYGVMTFRGSLTIPSPRVLLLLFELKLRHVTSQRKEGLSFNLIQTEI
jgi:hypothetical protein